MTESVVTKPAADGLHEAVLGFKACMQRYRKLRITDTRKAFEWHAVALQHLKLLVSGSNLPSMMDKTPDQIIEELSL
jgi:hypothetical protein